MKTDSYVCPMTLPCCGCAQLAESCTSVCSLCGHCSECSQCSECNKYNLAQKNNQKYIKSKKIQFHEEEKRGVSQNSINNYIINVSYYFLYLINLFFFELDSFSSSFK